MPAASGEKAPAATVNTCQSPSARSGRRVPVAITWDSGSIAAQNRSRLPESSDGPRRIEGKLQQAVAKISFNSWMFFQAVHLLI